MLTAVLLFASLLAPAMDYPTPAQAGFHHCALIYRNERRSVEDMKPYVAQWKDGKAQRWLFDSFLYLVYTTSRGIRTEMEATQKVDWDDQLDFWFKNGRDLDSLDKALDEASRSLGTPPQKRQIMLSIPYMHSSVKDFGDVNGDGTTEDLSKEAGRRVVLNWYIGEAERRFQAAGYKHLSLWGFYWMNEATGSGDADKIKLASNLVHQAGYKLLWIPWHRAPRWEQWKSFGFDVAIMQPNYAFVTSIHKGSVKRNRLAANADMTRAHGLGVEMETGNVATSDADRRAFYHYLADGAKSRYGYQNGATAYYLSNDNVERCAASPDPEIRRVYDLLCDYVSGKEVPDQDPQVSWKSVKYPLNLAKPVKIEGRLAKQTMVKSIEVYIDESSVESAWQGSIKASIKNSDGHWVPAGWAIKADRDPNSGIHQVAVIPVEQAASAIRLSFEPASGSKGRLAMVCIDGTKPEQVKRHLAYRQPYSIEQASGSPTYGDDGSFLTDGYIPKLGFLEHKSVGWNDETVSINFDLGKPRSVSAVEAVCEYNSNAAVYWPSSALALLSNEPLDLTAPSGFGALPASLVWLAPSKPVTEQLRPDGSLDGKLVFAPREPVRARYAAVLMQANSWLMVSEVRVLAGGKNVAPEGTYSLNPGPTVKPSGVDAYPDDGRKLVDGKIAMGFWAGMLVGWEYGPYRTATIDLGSDKAICKITVWSLKGGFAGIVAPKQVSVEVSNDGRHWYGKKSVAKEPMVEDGKTCTACAYKITLSRPAKARFVRVQVEKSSDWAMLSEIAVE